MIYIIKYFIFQEVELHMILFAACNLLASKVHVIRKLIIILVDHEFKLWL